MGCHGIMKHVLITGANSYIGDSFRNYLLQEPDKYSVTIKDTMGWNPTLEDFKGYDVVFNVAGIAHIKETKKNRPMYYAVNRDLAISIAKAAKEAGVKQFILLSTMSVYGMLAGHITKSTKPNPTNAYGKSKLQADRAINKMAKESNGEVRFACLRPPMVYGKGCKGNYQTLRSFALKSPIFPDYNNQRSMIYIGNLCEFIKQVIDNDRSGLFFPQNAEYVNTSRMVELVSLENNKKIGFVKKLNFAIKAFRRVNIVQKVFGNLVYEPVDLVSKFSFEQSIKLTEMSNRERQENIEPEDNPLVSILTVSYNSEKTISRTIEAVLNQTYPNIEYIIIDGASTDKTAEVARSYQKQFDNTPGRSLLVVSEPDKGMYDALNKGAKLAHGVLVGQTNADDWYEADAVKTMVELYKTTHYDVAWGSIRVKKPTGDMIKHAKIGKLWTTSGWCHPAMFSKKKTLLEFPYVCESMYDDFDFITAVRQTGKKIETIDRVISNFSFGGMSTKKSLKEVKKRVDILYRVYRKHGFSRLYYVHRWIIEMAKYALG